VAGGDEVELARMPAAVPEGADTFSQRRLLVGPGGRTLVYAGPGGQLRVRGPGGEVAIERVNGRDARFSPDGRLLAVMQARPGGESWSVMLFAADGTGGRELGRVRQPGWVEWVEGGVVVTDVDQARSGAALRYFPLAGKARLLVSHRSMGERFTAASRGTRVLFFVDLDVLSVDVNGGEPRRVGRLPHVAWNVEMKPDGSEAAIVAGRKLYRWTPSGMELLETSRPIHTVWYSDDGESLAYASLDRATLVTGGRRRELRAQPGAELRSLRFRRGGDGLVAVRGGEVLLWRPDAADPVRVLARSRAGQTLLGADAFEAGPVLWTEDRTAPSPRASLVQQRKS
jgi:hypothetical protein